MRPAEDAELVSALEQVLDSAIKLQRADFGDVQLYDSEAGRSELSRIGGLVRSFWNTSPASTRSIHLPPGLR